MTSHQFSKEYGSRVFMAILDLAISQTNCTCELDDRIKIWNKYFASDNLYGNTPQSAILESQSFFEGKLYLQRYLNSFVLKFRAHWDKIMGLYFLIWKYDLYPKFIRAHKKKKMFLENFEGHQMVETRKSSAMSRMSSHSLIRISERMKPTEREGYASLPSPLDLTSPDSFWKILSMRVMENTQRWPRKSLNAFSISLLFRPRLSG